MTVAFDIDGTIFGGSLLAQDWDCPEQVLEHTYPWPQRCRVVPKRGTVFVTGRTEAVRDATTQQLEAAGFKEFTLLMQPFWRGWQALEYSKAAHLRSAGASAYVGDLPSDRRAAALADADFLTWNEYARRRRQLV